MTGNLEAALAYAEKFGIPVMPLEPRDKRPVLKDWVNRASTDPETILGWWGPRPGCNVGGVMGDVVCIDADVADDGSYDGRDWVAEWEAEHGKLPETATAVTGRGGMHLFYRVDREIAPSVNGAVHVDIRGRGSQAVLPPSIHPNGNGYYWDLDPEDVGIADADDNVYALIEAARPEGGGKRDTSIPKGKKKEGEGRNDWLYHMGASQRGKGADDDVVWAYMDSLNRMKCSPPLDEREFGKVYSQVCKLPIGPSKEAMAAMEAAKPKRGRPRKFNHADIAEKLMEVNGACFVDGMPAIRHGDVYRIGWNSVNREIILLEREATRANQREVQHYLSVMADKKEQSPPNLIAFRNGVLDVKTMELRGYDPEDVIPNVIPHDWNPEAENAAVDAVLERMACGDYDIYLNLIEVMGVCMYRSSEFTQSAILLGDGSNGKSTFIRMLTALLGKENISALSMSQLDKQFLTGQLAGKLANLGSEISNEFKNGDLLSKFKELVDGNRTHADVKGVEGFDFESYATMVLCANEFPRLSDYSDGMMRRIFPIEFNARFKKTDPDYNPRISHDVSTEAACERMALLGVIGLLEVIRANGFTQNAASSRRVEEIRSDNDSTLAWALEEGLDADAFDGTPTSSHYVNYKQWCQKFGYRDVSHNKFTRMVKKNFGMDTRKRKVAGKAANCFVKKGTTFEQTVLKPDSV